MGDFSQWNQNWKRSCRRSILWTPTDPSNWHPCPGKSCPRTEVSPLSVPPSLLPSWLFPPLQVPPDSEVSPRLLGVSLIKGWQIFIQSGLRILSGSGGLDRARRVFDSTFWYFVLERKEMTHPNGLFYLPGLNLHLKSIWCLYKIMFV